VTIVPYHLGRRPKDSVTSADPTSGRRLLRRSDANGKPQATGVSNPGEPALPSDRTPIADIQYRQHARVAGRIHAVRVQPHGGVASLECTLVDDTGGITLLFLGRRTISGLNVGARIIAEGTVGADGGHLAILNPMFEFLPDTAAKH